MTKQEARALAAKREAHKSKYMSDKTWEAVHDSVKGWHVALVDNHARIAQAHRENACNAAARGDLLGLIEHTSQSVLAQLRANMKDANP